MYCLYGRGKQQARKSEICNNNLFLCRFARHHHTIDLKSRFYVRERKLVVVTMATLVAETPRHGCELLLHELVMMPHDRFASPALSLVGAAAARFLQQGRRPGPPAARRTASIVL